MKMMASVKLPTLKPHRLRRGRRPRRGDAATAATGDDDSSDGYDSVCDGDGDDRISWEATHRAFSADDADDCDEEVEDDEEEEAEETVEEADDEGKLNAAVESAINRLREAQQVVARLCARCPSDDASDGCVIPGDVRLSLPDHLNQSAWGSNAENSGTDCDTTAEETDASEAAAEEEVEEAEGDPDAAEREAEGWPEKRRPRRQRLTTCEEDVIGQRLNACLRLLQGGPYQECDLCVATLSSCDQNQLTSRELMERLSNLELMLLYLQVHFRSQMSCGKLKLLCQLKKTIGCLHGFLLRRQSEEATSQVERLHRRLDRTGDFRRHWRPVPAGGEKFRFVADPLDCVPRVAAEDEWLRAFLPESERASLGHVLSDSDPLVAEELGRRMAFTKRRGRSTRLHNLFTRDTYEDLLGRFQFALR